MAPQDVDTVPLHHAPLQNCADSAFYLPCRLVFRVPNRRNYREHIRRRNSGYPFMPIFGKHNPARSPAKVLPSSRHLSKLVRESQSPSRRPLEMSHVRTSLECQRITAGPREFPILEGLFPSLCQSGHRPAAQTQIVPLAVIVIR